MSGINFIPFFLQNLPPNIFVVFLKKYKIKQTISLAKCYEGYETKTFPHIFRFCRKQITKQKKPSSKK